MLKQVQHDEVVMKAGNPYRFPFSGIAFLSKRIALCQAKQKFRAIPPFAANLARRVEIRNRRAKIYSARHNSHLLSGAGYSLNG